MDLSISKILPPFSYRIIGSSFTWAKLFLTCLGLCFAFILGLEGCAVSQKYEISVPDRNIDAGSFGINNVIDLPNLQLSVKPFNGRLVSTFNTVFIVIPLPINPVSPYAWRFGKGKEVPTSPFLIEIGFYPKEKDLSIQPSQILLSLKDQVYKPSGITLPTEFSPMQTFGKSYYQGLNLCFLPHNMKPTERIVELQPVVVEKGKMACIWLSFDILPPPPENQFDFIIKGIKIGNKEIEIPKLHFVKGIAYRNDSIP
ncbi:MAG TPA: hypothetical protein VLY20_04130 [Nitrospiria bacterium]|nr:hypothetical protein [Nitrospiria bacterium]